MRKILFTILGLILMTSMSFSQLIISQYIETGAGTTPKGIELWNKSGATIDFAVTNLDVKQGTNGGVPVSVFTLITGTLAANAVIVIGTDADVSGAGTGFKDFAIANGAAFYTKAFGFNGDDALEIWLGGALQDVFGTPGVDPGTNWSGSGVSTMNQNISLKSGISTGDIVGWTDPSIRFETTTTDNSLTGFGLAPATTLSSAKDITAYSFAEQTGPATIDGTNHTVDIEVANATNLTALVATFTLSPAASAAISGTSQVSGTTANDFTNPVIYTITAEDASTQDWTVTVTEALPPATIDWCNLQWPASGTVCQGSVFNVYTQVYQAGVTEAAGQGAGIEAWIGYSLTNTDPSTWTDWVVASYNTDAGNNDEYVADLGSIPAGNYYYASRLRYNNGTYAYGGYVGGFWDGVTNVNGTLTLNAIPTPTITGTLSYCAGSNTTLDAGTYSNYLWSSTETTQTISATAGTYSVQVTDANGCVGTSADVVVVENALPTPSITGTLSYCAGSSTTLDAGSYSNYLWSSTETTQTISVTAGTYSVQVTDANGCVGTSADVVVVENALPTPSITGTMSYCAGSNTTLDAGLYTSYLWSSTETTQTISATAGTYSVQVIDANGCTGTSADVVVVENANPTPSITGTLSYCQGSNTTLDAGAYSSYLWSSTETTQTITATAGTYSVQVTDANGCFGTSADVVVVENANPTPVINGSLSYCTGFNTTLDAGVYSSYLWSTTGTTQTVDVTTADNPVIVTVTDANGCVGISAGVTVSESANLTPTISGILSYCEGSNTTLNAGSYTSYLWSGGETTQTITATAGTYSVQVTDANGCTGTSADVVVVENANPIPSITGTLAYCQGSNTTLDAGSYSSYLWSSTETTQTISATAGTYSVQVTDANGCTGTSANVIVVENSNPAPVITGTLTYIQGNSALLDAGSYNSYAWSTSATIQTINATIADNPIDVTVTDVNGCSGVSSSVNVIEISTEKDIIAYSFAEQTGAALIDALNHTVDIEVANGTDVTTLVATFTLSAAASADVLGTPQVSATTANDFTNPVVYTITAEDASTQDWTVTVTVASTSCPTEAFPFVESFDNGGNIPICWVNEAANTWDWNFLASTISSGGAISGDHTSGTGYFAYFNSYDSNGAGDIGELTSPVIDLTTSNNPELHFFWNRPSTGYTARLEVNIFANGTWNNDIYPGLNTQTVGWKEVVINMASFKYNDVQIRFKVTSDWWRNIGLDDVSIVEAPACPAPSLLTSSNLTSGSVDLNWTENGTATAWNIEYGAVGFTHGTGILVSANSKPYTLTPINANTSYDIYVQSDCGGGSISSWVGPITITTPCTAAALPWVESFESVTVAGNMPDCMTKTGGFLTGLAPQSYNRAPRTGSNYLYTDWNANDWTYTPGFYLNAGTSYDFSTWYVTDGITGWTTVALYAGTTQAAINMTDSLSGVSSPVNTAYSELKGVFVPSVSGVYYFGLHVVGNSNPWYITFDDFNVKETPTDAVDWCNLQYPDVATIEEGFTFTAYAQAFEPGVTEVVGQGAGINAWIGYSSTDTDPSTWTNWIPATFNVDAGNNDEYMATFGALLPIGTYYYASRFQLNGGLFTYGGYNIGGGDFWDGVTNVSGVLNVIAPTCATPTALTASNITSSSADLTWTENGTAINWNIEYGAIGFSQGTGNLVSANANPFMLSPLNSNTGYDVYVQADCGAGDVSSWYGPISINTLCGTATLPWVESFESVTVAGNMPDCMTKTGGFLTGLAPQSYNRAPRTGSNYLYNNWTADDWTFTPGFDLVAGTSYDFSTWYITDGLAGWTTVALYAGSSQASINMTDSLSGVSSPVNTVYSELKGTFVPSVSGVYYFGLHVVATSNPWYITFDDFNVKETPTDVVDWCNLQFPAIESIQQGNNFTAYAQVYELGLTEVAGQGAGINAWIGYSSTDTDPSTWTNWIPAVYNLDAGNNDEYMATFGNTLPVSTYYYASRFQLNGGPFNYGGYVGGFWDGITNVSGVLTIIPPTCPAPTALTVSNITSSSVDVAWTENGTASAWDVEYGAPGFSLGTGTMVSVTVNPVTLNGFGSDSDFDIYVRSDCGAGDYSVWVGPIAFKTYVANDECVNAITIVCNDVVAGSTSNATVDDLIAPACGTVAVEAPGVWYKILGTGELITLSTCSDASYDTKLSVYDGDCGNLNCVAANDDQAGCTGYTSETSFTSVIGTEYFVLVHGYSLSDYGDFNLTVTCSPACTPIPANDVCASSQNLSLSMPGTCVPTTGTNQCANAAFDNPSCDPFGTIQDVWYSFNSGNVNSVSMDLVLGSATDINYALYDNCGGNQITCNSSPVSGINIINVTPSTDYFVRIWNAGGANAGDFTICLEENNTLAEILAFNLPNQTGPSVIDNINHTVDIELGFGTNPTALVADFTLSYAASASIAGIQQVSTVTSNDFSTSLIYDVTAQNGTVVSWTVNVTVATTLNNQTDFLTYSFVEQTNPATIDNINHTIDIEVNWLADVANLTADFTLSYGANADISTVPQISGVTANDFTNPVIYTVTAEDGTTIQAWTVTVSKEVHIPQIVITEIMYNSPESGSDSLEYVEIYNNDVMPFDLAGYSFVGVTYTFPTYVMNPGDYAVIAFNPTAITNNFGLSGVLQYTGALSNNGEFIVLKNGATVIDSVNFDDVLPWNVLADGYGRSLVLCDPNSDNSDVANWTISTTNASLMVNTYGVFASPGAADACLPLNTGNDILTYSFAEETSPAVIDNINHNIDIEVAFGTNLSALVADFTLSQGAIALVGTAHQISGTTPNSFVTVVTYAVISESSAGMAWTVNVTVAPAPVTDLALLEPMPNNYESCNMTASETVDILLSNVGNTVFTSGTSIDVSYQIDANPIVTETIVLTSDLNPGDSLAYTFAQTIDLSAVAIYNWNISIDFVDDSLSNNSTAGTIEHIEINVNIAGGDTVSLYAFELPFTLSTIDIYDNYTWSDATGTNTSNAATIDADSFGWYYVTVTNNNGCSAIDSIFIEEIIQSNLDVAIVFPNVAYFEACNMTGNDNVQIMISNFGTDVIPTGEIIYGYYQIDGGSIVKDSIVLPFDFNPLDTITFVFSQTVDFSALTTYNYNVYIEYAGDLDNSNDTIVGQFAHVVYSLNLDAVNGGINDTLTVSSYPATLDAGAGYGGYSWVNVTSDVQTAIVTQDGWYGVDVFNDFGCYAFDSIYVKLFVGMDVVDAKTNINIYPNPNKGEFNINIELSKSGNLQIDIMNYTGQIISTDLINNVKVYNKSEDFSDLPKGIYFVKINDGYESFVKKIVIQ